VVRGNSQKDFLHELGMDPFQQRFPWIGGDLQTLRDTFVSENLPIESGEIVQIEIPSMPSREKGSGKLIALLDRPSNQEKIRGLVLMLHGLGGSSSRTGLRRMAFRLISSGFAVLRLNLRGAAPGRKFASGTYSANCNSDLIPAIAKAREICMLLATESNSKGRALPLFGVGISLGGTILLNASLNIKNSSYPEGGLLDGLVCLSSPLDLASCSASIEKPRNRIYQKWLLNRLIKQTIEDPFGILDEEKDILNYSNIRKSQTISTLREFDSFITAPRWGFKDVVDYYKRASPFYKIFNSTSSCIKNILFVQSLDDPWVPSETTEKLLNSLNEINSLVNSYVVITSHGGHNGFHGKDGCWGDELVANWLLKLTT